MGEFERKRYRLRQEGERLKDLYLSGLIDKVEFGKEAQRIGDELARLDPAAHPDAACILPMLEDWPGTWEKMNGLQRRTILGTLFSGLYFDKDGKLVKVVAYPPFEELFA